MLDENTLFIIGAGASKSLSDEIKDKENIFALGSGYSEMPLGWELVKKISKYRIRSVSRFICHVILQIYSTKIYQELSLNKFNLYSDTINRALKSLYNTKDISIEDEINILLRREILNPEEREKCELFFKKKLKSTGTNSDFVGKFPVIINAVSFCILKNHNHYAVNCNIEYSYRFISEITRDISIDSNIIQLIKHDRISYYENSNVTTKSIFGDARKRFDEIVKKSEQLILRNKKYSLAPIANNLSTITKDLIANHLLRNDKEASKIINFLNELSGKSINKENLNELKQIRKRVQQYFFNLVANNNINQSNLENSLSSIDIITEREEFFARYIILEDKVPDLVEKKCNNIKNEEVLKYVVTTYIAGYMMNLFNPSSVDDFVMNFEFYTRYEDIHRKNNENLPSSEDIQQYIKYLIACVLLEDFYATMIFSYGYDNYIKFISRLVISGCLNDEKKLEQSLQNLKFINFNYDTTLFALLTEYIPALPISNYYNSNVFHPYGKLVYVDVKNEEAESPEKVFDNLDVGIWDKFFDKIDYNYTIHGTKINVFKQSSDIISLVREKDHCEEYEKNRNRMQSHFLNAETVCFCGFGFDKNNLTYLGLLSKDSKKPISEIVTKSKEKKIYISSVNNKIIMTLEEVFGCKMIKFTETSHWDKKKNIYIIKNIWKSDKGNIVASENNLNYALNNDFLF